MTTPSRPQEPKSPLRPEAGPAGAARNTSPVELTDEQLSGIVGGKDEGETFVSNNESIPPVNFGLKP